MACCAIAAFIICNALMLFRRTRQRLFGTSKASPTKNAAVGWTLGAVTGPGTSVPRRAPLRWLVAVAFGLGFAGTAMASRFVEPGTPRSALVAIEQFVERSHASICGSAHPVLTGVARRGNAPLEQ